MNKKAISFILVISIIMCFYTNVCAKWSQKGDVDDNGKYNLSDYILIKQALVGIANIDEDLADANGDGEFNIEDANTYAKYLANLGELYKTEQPGWIELYDWEDSQEGETPSGVNENYGSLKTKSLSLYSPKNTKNTDSKYALSVVPNGPVDTSASSKGSNPTTGELPSTIATTGKLDGATNLRALINIKKPSDTEYYFAYIGCQIGTKRYFYPIEIESYSDSFNYFYFVGKEMTRYTTNKRFTYLSSTETRVITKDDIPNIRNILVWMEAVSPSPKTALIIDDIQYYDGANGYDSTAEDSALPLPQEPQNDGTQKYLCVAFDDGPQYYTDSDNSELNDYYMNYYMDLAKEYDAHFTFCLGGGTKLNDNVVPLLQKAIDNGHELANHTWSHTRLTTKEDDEVIEEITKVDNWLYSKFGIKTSVIRYPFYDCDAYVTKLIKDNIPNIKTAIFGNCPSDYNYTSVDYRKLYYQRHISDGTITLTHENIVDNIEVVRWMLDYYTKLGYKFVSVSELFEIKGITPDLSVQYYSVH